MEKIFLNEPQPQILIPLEEYKELLVTKGKYESLKNINIIKENNETLNKNLVIKFLKEQINNCIDFQLQNIKSEHLKDYMSARKTKIAYSYLLQQIKRGEFDAD